MKNTGGTFVKWGEPRMRCYYMLIGITLVYICIWYRLDSYSPIRNIPPSPVEDMLEDDTYINITDQVEGFLIDNEERKRRVQEECSKFMAGEKPEYVNLTTVMLTSSKSGDFRRFLVSSEYRFALCKVAKAGTTTFANSLMQLIKDDHPDIEAKSKHAKLRKDRDLISQQEKLRLMETLKGKVPLVRGILPARHPIDRLYSAYNNKIIEWSSKRQTKYGRGNIVKSIASHGSSSDDPKQTGISFENFLKSIAMDGIKNIHWRPVWKTCNVCYFNFEFFIKMETYSRDLDSALKIVAPNKHVHIEQLNKSAASKEPINYEKLLENVPSEVLLKLLSLYYLDFVLYDYDIESIYGIYQRKKEAEIKKIR